jgi:hypothetical protein
MVPDRTTARCGTSDPGLRACALHPGYGLPTALLANPTAGGYLNAPALTGAVGRMNVTVVRHVGAGGFAFGQSAL